MWPFTPKNPPAEVTERWIEKRRFRKLGRVLETSADAESCKRVIARLGPVVEAMKGGDLTPYWKGLDALEAATRNADAGVRLAALEQLANIHDDQVAVKVYPLIDDPCEEVAVAAASIVAFRRHYGSMIASLSSPNDRGRKKVVEALIATVRFDVEYIETLDRWIAGEPAEDGRECPKWLEDEAKLMETRAWKNECAIAAIAHITRKLRDDCMADVGLEIVKAFTQDPIKAFLRAHGIGPPESDAID